MLLDNLLAESASRLPDKTAVAHGNSRTSYAEIIERGTALAATLQDRGLRQGDRVVIALENSAEYVIASFGALLAGCVTVPVSHLSTPDGLAKIAADCNPSAIITGSAFANSLARAGKPVGMASVVLRKGRENEVPEGAIDFQSAMQNPSRPRQYGPRSGSDAATIIYTSGTTGEPKGVTLSHANLLSNTASIVEYLSLRESDSVMVVLSFNYSYGNSLLLTHVKAGGTLVIDNRFIYPNLILETLLRESVTGFAGVPSTFAILFHRSNFRNMQFPALRYITQAGGPMPAAMALELARTVPHAKVFIMYGQTEASARLSYLPPDDLFRKPGSIGKAIPGVTLEVVKEDGTTAVPGEAGEIVATGANIMQGYWGRPEETAEVVKDGRLFTGDMATVDEDGYLYIVSRKKDLIKSGAHRIAPREIEEVILEHPSVHEAAVVGREDLLLGEAIWAFIVLKDGQGCSEAEIMKLCSQKLPSFKLPKSVRFVGSLPKTESGKIKKGELRDLEAFGG